MDMERAAWSICHSLLIVLFFCNAVVPSGSSSVLTPGFRPPSVPLVVSNPYLSIWSAGDHLYDAFPQHWTGTIVALSGMVLIDKQPYRFMGSDIDLASDPMEQVSLSVYPTQTKYAFEKDGIRLNLTFTSLWTLPLTYLTYTVESIDGKPHSVQLYYDNTAEGTVSSTSNSVTWNRKPITGYDALYIGSVKQDYLENSDLIDWGYWYLLVPQEANVSTTIQHSTVCREAFMKQQKFPPDDTNKPRPCNENWPTLAASWELGVVSPGTPVTKYLAIFYDEIYSIRYYGTTMEPYWRVLYNADIGSLLKDEYHDLVLEACDELDSVVTSELYEAGGSNYTTICSLSWRQVTGALSTVWNNVTNETWVFMKEISSDGDVSTVDVIYPASPFFLWAGPDYLKLLMKPILELASNHTAMYGLNMPCKIPYAPHHLGRWPVCDLDPTTGEQMPIEETANMLNMIAAVFDVEFVKEYLPVLEIWGKYLLVTLPDPGNQLCTDDFEGPSPHNANLAVKGIVGIGSYAYILDKLGYTDLAQAYQTIALGYAEYWMQVANDSDHYRLQYNLPNTWSLKYNLLYQKILNFNLFPEEVFQVEETYYQTKMNKYGVPLDNRADFTKTDWEMWIAALGNAQQFKAISDAVYKFANETPDRVPFTDWYYTSTAKQRGFRARPVIGGLYARALLSVEDSVRRQYLL